MCEYELDLLNMKLMGLAVVSTVLLRVEESSWLARNWFFMSLVNSGLMERLIKQCFLEIDGSCCKHHSGAGLCPRNSLCVAKVVQDLKVLVALLILAACRTLPVAWGCSACSVRPCCSL